MAMSYQKNFILALALVLGMCSSLEALRSLEETFMLERYDQWIAQYGRLYKNDSEKAIRFEIFKKNVKYIESFNNEGNQSYKLGINAFADMTNEEFCASHNGYKNASQQKSPGTTGFRYKNLTAVPTSMDWREKGAVTGVKNQLQCGCCWAFSAVAAMEGINQLTSGKLISLSEQELVDCDVNGQDHGCNGGYVESAFEFIINNNGLTTESNYPYKGTDGLCNSQKEVNAAKITGYENVPTNSESALLQAVANQPVSVIIDAGGSSFQFYTSGVFTGGCGTDLNHAVTAVGYGTSEDGKKYWLVKNSWGTSWGEEGYIKIERDINAEGLCGIAMRASYPTA